MTQHTSTVENRVSIPQQIELHNPSNLTNRAIQTMVGIADIDLATMMHDELTTRHGYTPTKALEALNALVNINHALDEVRAGRTPPLTKDLAHYQAVLRQVATLLSESPLASDINKQITALNALLNGSPELALHILEAKPHITPPTPFDQAHARARNDSEPVPTTSPKVMHQHISTVEMAEYKHSTEFNQTKQAERVAKQAARAAELQTLIDQPIQTIQPTPQPHPSEDDMNLKQLTTATLMTGTVMTTSACDPKALIQPTHNSSGQEIVTGAQFDITPKPNPQQAYKLKVKLKDVPAPGFKKWNAYVYFDIPNVKDCGYYIGGAYQDIVPGIDRAIDFPLKQISANEFEGVFYTDWGQDGDFFGKGVCHWRFRTVSASFRATGTDGETWFSLGFESQTKGDRLFAPNKPLTRFYLKEFYPKDVDFAKYPEGYSDTGINEEVSKQHPVGSLFSITITAEELH